jgi:subfamily B ATP-binding cassette protein HlyB/CyaB
VTQVTGSEPDGQAAAARPVEASLAALIMLARFHEVSADFDTVSHRFPADPSVPEATRLLRVAKALGLKAGLKRVAPDRLDKATLPALAEMREGGFIVLAKVDDDRVLVQDPAAGRPEVVPRTEFHSRWTGRLLLVTSRASLAGKARRFDLTWFIPSLVKYRRLFGEVLVSSFFLQMFALMTPIFFQVVIDKVLVHRSWATLDVLVFALVVTVVFETLLTGLRTYVFSHTTSRLDVELGARLYDHALSLPLSYFQARRVGDTVARARELENVRSFLTGQALTVVLDVVFGLAFFAVMFVYSPILTLVVALTIPLYILISVLVTPVLRRRLDEKFDRGAENQAFLVESIGAVETLKAMAVEPRMQSRWEQQLAAYVSAGFRAQNLSNWAGQAVQLVSKLTTAAVLWFGARLVMEGQLSVGELIAFNMLAGRVAAPILRLSQLWQDFQQFKISIERLGDILNAVPEPRSGPGRGALPAVQGHIRLEHLAFRYRPETSRVLEDISIDIPAGQVVGIVGPSGSGKSTLTKVIQRLYIPESGRILIDGVDLALADPAWLRRQIGVVLQENVLMNRSVRDNIALALPEAGMDQVVTSAKLAGAHEFILELPFGYDTEIGERGASLSGGQRQRVAIARALITNPRILILDEATSALDYESERIIQQNMRLIAKGRTVLIIAHRLAAVRDADRIITVEKGRVTEDGTHDDLLRRGGRYAGLWRHQIGAIADPAE